MAIIVGGSTATFLDAVNRVLRLNHIIKGDDDNLTSFGDTQHAADIELAQLAIQEELSDVISSKLLGYEKMSGSISLVQGTRTYALATDFIRFYGENPSFYDATNNVRIYELKGGLDKLRDADYLYATNQGTPQWWYWEPASSYQVGFYNVPDSAYNGRSLSYDYEASIMVEVATDVMPIVTTEAFYTFCTCAARRFKQMDGSLGDLSQDGMWVNSRARLNELMRPTNPSKHYGRKHG
jgi:hypothetical protein